MAALTLPDLVRIMFSSHSEYETITKKEKEDFFFIFNRQMSRKLPEHAERFNHRRVNKEIAMDTWLIFIHHLQNSGDRDFPNNRMPKWFWGTKRTEVPPQLTPDQFILKLVEDKNPILSEDEE